MAQKLFGSFPNMIVLKEPSRKEDIDLNELKRSRSNGETDSIQWQMSPEIERPCKIVQRADSSNRNVYSASCHRNHFRSNSTSSIQSYYENKIFGITCIVVMASCFLLVVTFSIISAFRDIGTSSFIVEKTHKRIEEDCLVEIVESLPKILIYPPNSIKFTSTFDAWQQILDSSEVADVKIASAYWSMKSSDVEPVNEIKPSAEPGETIFKQLLAISASDLSTLTVVDDLPYDIIDDNDTVQLKDTGAEVRYINMTALVGAGILHTKLIINKAAYDFYVGSANMDWRSLTLVKELGFHFNQCPTLMQDILKIFDSYYLVAVPNASLPTKWPKLLSTSFNKTTPLDIKLSGIDSQIYFSVSPPEFLSEGRTGDLDAILEIMDKAAEFIYVSVMDFVPGFLYNPTFGYWPTINDRLLFRAINHNIKVRLLISKWQYTGQLQTTFLESLNILHNISNIEIRLFEFPEPNGTYIEYTLVNHNKYMVTDNCGYIGTNNWSADYFVNTGGIGTIVNQTNAIINNPSVLPDTIQEQLRQVFMRDWESSYAYEF